MPAGGESRRASPDPLDARPTFTLARFEWGAPDRLELAGAFSGIAAEPAAEPVLTVQGPDGPRRLPALQDATGEEADGAPWTAAFAWLEAPVAFDRARLELGTAFAVELPAPGEGLAGRSLPVTDTQDGAAGAAAGRLRLEAELLDARQQLEEARATARRAQEELDRARADLTAERERAAADAERFREGLATVRGSAEEALGAAALARSRADEEAQTEIAALRERVAALEPAAAELDAIRSERDAAQSALAGARGSAQELLDRLTSPADPRAGGR